MKRIGRAVFVLVLSALSFSVLAADKTKDGMPPSCTCKNLPAMVKEIIEQEFLQDLFFSWNDYLPSDINDIATMQNRATQLMQQHFNPKAPKNNAGTANGAHAELGTDFRSPGCTIGAFQYDVKGNPVLDNNGDQVVTPQTEEEYMKSQKKTCEALARYPYVHEQYHEKTCKDLNAAGKQSKWDSLEFFARNDSEAYKAGVDYLRQQTKALALSCGWQGSTGTNAVPTPKDALKLAKKGGKIVKGRAGARKSGHAPIAGSIAIITGVAITDEPLEDLIVQWEQSCASAPADQCDGLASNIEVGLYDLIRTMQRSGANIERETLFELSHTSLPMLKRQALAMLGYAQSPDEIDFAVQAVDDPSPAVRDAAERMLQGTDDARWKAMQKWRPRDRSGIADGVTAGLVPELAPQPGQLEIKPSDNLHFRYFASTRERAVFTSKESAEAIVKKMSEGREVMKSADAIEKNMNAQLPMMQAMQQEMMAAAAAGDSKKLNELIVKMTEMQKQFTAVDPRALNPTKNSTAIIIAKAADGHPTQTATIQRDDIWGETIVTLWREGGWR